MTHTEWKNRPLTLRRLGKLNSLTLQIHRPEDRRIHGIHIHCLVDIDLRPLNEPTACCNEQGAIVDQVAVEQVIAADSDPDIGMRGSATYQPDLDLKLPTRRSWAGNRHGLVLGAQNDVLITGARDGKIQCEVAGCLAYLPTQHNQNEKNRN